LSIQAAGGTLARGKLDSSVRATNAFRSAHGYPMVLRHPRNVFTAPSMTHFAARFFAPELAAWRGQQPLWRVFWLYGVAVSSAMIATYLLAFLAEAVALRQILLLCFIPYTVWILVSIWRCSNNVHEQFWRMLARLLTVAWACNAILIVIFVEMNLITHYYLQH
jgi:hypothetical protein